jgi:hypothetical protein
MAATLKQWQVLPHGPLTPVEPNIMTVVGQIHMPVGDMPRRMTVVRLRDSRLVIFSAISLDEAEMRRLEEFGRPAFLIVPSDHHRRDAQPWKARYPAIFVIAPEGAREKVAKEVRVDAVRADFDDPDVVFITVPGTRGHESALEVRTPLGLTLVLNDLVGNIRHSPGFSGWMLRVMGFAGKEPHIPMPIRASMVADKKAVREQLLRWAAIDDLRRVLVSHGDTIDVDPQGALRELAKSLA